jgi:hypothetical protein
VSYKNDSQVWYIYKNETLRVFAKNRPHNLKSLRGLEKLLTSPSEVSHLHKYWEEIIKWLNLLI